MKQEIVLTLTEAEAEELSLVVDGEFWASFDDPYPNLEVRNLLRSIRDKLEEFTW